MIHIKKIKKTTNFEPTNIEDVLNKTYLVEKLFKIEGHLSEKITTNFYHNRTNILWKKF